MSTRNRDNIMIYDEADFAGMRKAGRLAAEILDMIGDHVQVGVTTLELDTLCHRMIMDAGAIPACVGYKGYAHATCISINEVVCHGIPSAARALKEGDIANIDVTVIVDGYYGDSSRMYFAGTPPVRARRLCQVTHECLWAGINTVKPGATFGDIGAAIQEVAHNAGYSVVRDFCGHGIGKVFHDHPSVMHVGVRGQGAVLEPGMLFTIEPMINGGRYETKTLADGWTAVTRDRSLSAQYEHTLGVTTDGVEVFTRSPKGLDASPVF